MSNLPNHLSLMTDEETEVSWLVGTGQLCWQAAEKDARPRLFERKVQTLPHCSPHTNHPRWETP